MLGSRSHQYQSPAFEKTAINRPTKIPLYPYSPAAIAPLKKNMVFSFNTNFPFQVVHVKKMQLKGFKDSKPTYCGTER